MVQELLAPVSAGGSDPDGDLEVHASDHSRTQPRASVTRPTWMRLCCGAGSPRPISPLFARSKISTGIRYRSGIRARHRRSDAGRPRSLHGVQCGALRRLHAPVRSAEHHLRHLSFDRDGVRCRHWRVRPVDPLPRDGPAGNAGRESTTNVRVAVLRSIRPSAPLLSARDDRPAGRTSHLLIGGTASVVGEDSRHAGNLDAQLDETLLNMEALVRTASGRASEHPSPLNGWSISAST